MIGTGVESRLVTPKIHRDTSNLRLEAQIAAKRLIFALVGFAEIGGPTNRDLVLQLRQDFSSGFVLNINFRTRSVRLAGF